MLNLIWISGCSRHRFLTILSLFLPNAKIICFLNVWIDFNGANTIYIQTLSIKITYSCLFDSYYLKSSARLFHNVTASESVYWSKMQKSRLLNLLPFVFEITKFVFWTDFMMPITSTKSLIFLPNTSLSDSHKLSDLLHSSTVDLSVVSNSYLFDKHKN